MSHWFMNAVEQNRKYADTFEIPSPAELQVLRNGDWVKVCVSFDGEEAEKAGCSGERFWVRLTDVSRYPELTGQVDNDLIFKKCHGLRNGVYVTFFTHNVLSIIDNPETEEEEVV